MIFNQRIIFILFIILIKIRASFEKSKWLLDLTKHLKDNSNTFQVILMIDCFAGSQHQSTIDEILQEITSKIPSKVVIYQEGKTTNISELKSRSLQKTTLFVKVQTDQTVSKSTVEILKRVTGSQTRPKCLSIILLDGKSSSHRELLLFAWANKFLDFTVIDLVKETRSEERIWHRGQRLAIIHHFNPYNEIYSRKRYTSETPVFPNKLHDLNNFEMKVGSFNYPPMVKVKRNTSGYPVEVTGPEAMIIKSFSKALNFRISEVSSREEWFGKYSCERNETTGFNRKLSRNEISLITNNVAVTSWCIDAFRALAISLEKNRLVPVVPVVVTSTRSLSFSWKSFYAGLLIPLLVTVIWMTLKFLKFDPRFWSLLNIVSAMLGIPVPEEVNRPAEKIAFVFIFFGFWLFSSTIHAILTDVKLTTIAKEGIETLADLKVSNLTILMQGNFLYALASIKNDEIVEALLKKSEVSDDIRCIQLLVKFKNVSCMLKEAAAEVFVQENVDENGTQVTKLVDDSLMVNPKSISLEPNSPYAFVLEGFLKRLRQSGFIGKWNGVSSFGPSSKMSQLEEDLQPNSLLIPLLLILTFGFGISLTVFVGELVFSQVQKCNH